MPPIKSKIRSLLILSIVMTPPLGTLSGCTQPDNPEPIKAEGPPPAPTPEELKVPKTAVGKTYGASDRYNKAMNKKGQ